MAVAALTLIKAQPFSSGFANATYNSLNAFLFIDGAGAARPVRWAMVPNDSFAPEPADTPADRNYLFARPCELLQSPAQGRSLPALTRLLET